MSRLSTIWSENAKAGETLSEYPRPQLVRNTSYAVLNGLWDYAFTDSDDPPSAYEGKIQVPFSPESGLSGVEKQLLPGKSLWYHLSVKAPQRPEGCRKLLLHFGAVDQTCEVWVNGKTAGAHTGGYLPFTLDITGLTDDGGQCDILIKVKDDTDTSFHARGKQKLKAGGMFYTAVSGIWQSVWMEWVPEQYIRQVFGTQEGDGSCVLLHVATSDVGAALRVRVFAPGIYDREEDNVKRPEDVERFLGREIACAETPAGDEVVIRIPESERKYWTQDTPWLYWVLVSAEQEGGIRDEAAAYFALRQFALSDGKRVISPPSAVKSSAGAAGSGAPGGADMAAGSTGGNTADKTAASVRENASGKAAGSTRGNVPAGESPRIVLNGKEQFHLGVLDQGYWPDGIYTPPSDTAMIFDIAEMKRFGFNMVRKHIKIEPQRWYYHCDRLGIAVWQDMVCGGGPILSWYVTYFATLHTQLRFKISDRHLRLHSRQDREGREEFERELKETIELLRVHPSIAVWVIFNEGWGQFETNRMTEIARKADPDRLIDQASGWFDQGGGDFSSLHHYFFRLLYTRERRRALALSECGGFPWMEQGHSMQKNLYGYGKFESRDEVQKAFDGLMEKMKSLKKEGFAAAVYTQWTDVEGEVNGIYTYDRKVRKIKSDPGLMRGICES